MTRDDFSSPRAHRIVCSSSLLDEVSSKHLVLIPFDNLACDRFSELTTKDAPQPIFDWVSTLPSVKRKVVGSAEKLVGLASTWRKLDGWLEKSRLKFFVPKSVEWPI